MGWFIKSSYRDAGTSERREETQRVPVHGDITDEIATEFRKVLRETLARAADDESDISVEVAYLGDRTAVRS